MALIKLNSHRHQFQSKTPRNPCFGPITSTCAIHRLDININIIYINTNIIYIDTNILMINLSPPRNPGFGSTS